MYSPMALGRLGYSWKRHVGEKGGSRALLTRTHAFRELQRLCTCISQRTNVRHSLYATYNQRRIVQFQSNSDPFRIMYHTSCFVTPKTVHRCSPAEYGTTSSLLSFYKFQDFTQVW